MEQHIEKVLLDALRDMGIAIDGLQLSLTVPQLQFGDYSTNIAMILAKREKKNPFELADHIGKNIKEDDVIEKAVALKPGFVNFWIKKELLAGELAEATNDTFSIPPFHFGPEKKIMVEFAHPNTHKLFHIGHLRNITTGESVVRILTAAGNTVIRSNYQGDVGMHIAKCLWGIAQMQKSNSTLFSGLTLSEKIKLIGKAYSAGQMAYESSETAKAEIITVNKQIYEKDPHILELWTQTRQWSVEYFEEIYARLYSHFDRCYFESEVHDAGLKNAQKLLEKGILKKSEGAVVFDGTPYGMDTRVFINSLGFPTYEGKELGLAPKEFSDFGRLDKCIHVVTPEQTSFFKITFKVEALMDPAMFDGKQHHLAYEWVKLKEGKMSSRTGNVIEATWLIDEIKKRIKAAFGSDEETTEALAVASIKYSFLKNATSSVIAFDIDESVSIEGNSAPYVLYTFVRTQGILEKAQVQPDHVPVLITDDEVRLARMVHQYPFVVHKAAAGLSPHLIAGHLYELAREYNAFYQKNPILKAEGDSKYARIAITKAVGATICHGMSLLGIKTVRKM